MWISGLRSRGPASINRTRALGSALSRLASTQPAEPAPTMIKSAFMLPSLNSPGRRWMDVVRPSRRPLRGLLRMRSFLYATKTTLMLRSAQRARLEARMLPMQRSCATSNHLVGAQRGDFAVGEAAVAQHFIGVGAQRRGHMRWRVGGAVAHRAGDHRHMTVIPDAAALGDERVVERGFQVVDRRRGN